MQFQKRGRISGTDYAHLPQQGGQEGPVDRDLQTGQAYLLLIKTKDLAELDELVGVHLAEQPRGEQRQQVFGGQGAAIRPVPGTEQRSTGDPLQAEQAGKGDSLESTVTGDVQGGWHNSKVKSLSGFWGINTPEISPCYTAIDSGWDGP